MSNLHSFSSQALPFTKSPLGIIGLFLVLVYGMATVAYGLANEDIVARTAIAFVLSVLPFAVLYAFFVMVTKHPMALYGPSDYKDEDIFKELQALAIGVSASDASLIQPDYLKHVARRLRILRDDLPSGQIGEFLWVDDNPENNQVITDSLSKLGISCVIAESTEDALIQIQENKFFAVVSDMGRKEGANEGYVLLKRIREAGIGLPFYIYAGSNKKEHQLNAIQEGAQGCTNNSMKLIQWLVKDGISNAIWL